MQNEINKVQSYFATRIAGGYYTIIEQRGRIIKIRVDKKYNFAFWIGMNDCNFEQFHTNTPNYMLINLTPVQRIAATFNLKKKEE